MGDIDQRTGRQAAAASGRCKCVSVPGVARRRRLGGGVEGAYAKLRVARQRQRRVDGRVNCQYVPPTLRRATRRAIRHIAAESPGGLARDLERCEIGPRKVGTKGAQWGLDGPSNR
jgi:hypothetical protein